MDDVTWRKSRHSNDQEGACVEVAALAYGVGMRDSKDPDGPKLLLHPAAFGALMSEIKQR
ncbi:DUF397 domain-containing protein [Actinomadura geliboluensis]|uniref:DUF397 domain-containing protein n=1 Tax=Actinomadura geliboluensis TaxID=882440 RepID=UPI00371CCFEB